MIGTLGDIVFEASEDKILTFQELQRSNSARYHEHNVIGKKPVIEFLGPGLDQVTMPIRLDVAHGVYPNKIITALKDYKHRGDRLQLVIGGHLFGDFVVEQVSENRQRHDNKGNCLVATVNLTLKESVD